MKTLVCAAVALCLLATNVLGENMTTQAHTSTPSVSASSTIAVTTAPQDACVRPDVGTGVAFGVCGILHGESCHLECVEGFVRESGDEVVNCTNGHWIGQLLTCQDFDACESQPCAAGRSVCIDQPAPSLSYTCECTDEYSGSPGTNGAGCRFRKRLTTDTLGMTLQVDDLDDVVFKTGSEVLTTVRSLLSAIESIEVGPIASLNEQLSNAVDTLHSELSAAELDLTAQLQVATASLESALSNEEQEREAAVSSLASDLADTTLALGNAVLSMDSRADDVDTSLDTLTTQQATTTTNLGTLGGRVTSLETLVDTKAATTTLNSAVAGLQTSIAQASASTTTRISNVETNLAGQVTSLTSQINGAKATASQGVANAATAQSRADSAYNLASTANTNAASAQSVANNVQSGLNNVISTLGCLASGCSSGYECSATTRQCVAGRFTGSTVANSLLLSQSFSGSTFSTLCYRGSTHGWSSTSFHTNCNGRQPIVVMARGTNNYIAGAYSETAFTTSSRGYQPGYSNFLFAMGTGSTFTKALCTNYPTSAIYDSTSYGPTFGNGHDWYVSGGMKNGYTYPYAYSGFSNTQMFGSYSSWTLSEIEVWA
eukprot:m.139429 g.139429  ORF g.139429 m.139429 type:complete len:602 (-) comp15945_c0_seq5:429-2234(-)